MRRWFGIWLSRIYSLADSDFSEHQRSPFLDGGYQHFNRNLPFLLFVCCSRQLLNVFAGILQGPELAAISKGDRDVETERPGTSAVPIMAVALVEAPGCN
jgi:hypothetical protein